MTRYNVVRNWTATLFILILSSPAYGDFVLDFEGQALSSGEPIPQSYGDNSLFDVSYRQLEGFGNAAIVDNDLYFWESGYGDLQNVVWGVDATPSTVAEIRFNSLTANLITLNTFDAAAWGGADAVSKTFRVFDENYNVLFELTNFDVTGVTRDSITTNVSSNTLILQWDDPWIVSIDNISITAVPEPSTSMLLGLCVGFSVFRKRRVTGKAKHSF